MKLLYGMLLGMLLSACGVEQDHFKSYPIGVKGSNGVQGTQGEAGKDGAQGKDGLNGSNGLNGTNGVNGTSPTILHVSMPLMNSCYILGTYSAKYTTGNQFYVYSDTTCNGTANTATAGTFVCHMGGTPNAYFSQQCMLTWNMLFVTQGSGATLYGEIITFN